MLRITVDSRAVISVGYDQEEQILEIEFRPSGVYDYFEVPPEIHEQLMAAESMGAFVNTQIKPQFECQKISD